MKITAIKQQLKRQGRYSIFLDGKYGFSLSDEALLSSGLVNGQDLSETELEEFKALSSTDKTYNQLLNYLAIRLRSRWEIETYLKRKNASPTLTNTLLNMLSNKQIIDDEKFARAWIRDRQLLRPTSRRKLILELRQKHVKDDDIKRAVEEQSPDDELQALREMIKRKRQQSRYADDTKLMQYLLRQGFSYGDVKTAIKPKE